MRGKKFRYLQKRLKKKYKITMKITEEDHKKLEEITMHTRALLHLLTNTNKNKKGINKETFYKIFSNMRNEKLINDLNSLLRAVNKILYQ